MRRGLIVMASLTLSVVASGQSIPDEHTIERPFSEGGIVTLNLSSGDYTMRAGASDRVRVQWRAEAAKDEKEVRKITVISDVFQRVAAIRTKGPTNRARFTIEVPPRSDVHCAFVPATFASKGSKATRTSA